MKTTHILLAASMLFALVIVGCSQGPTESRPDAGSVVLDLNFASGAEVQAIDSITVTVTGEGIEVPIVASLSYIDGVIVGVVDVPAGPARTFTIRVFSLEHGLIYEGSTVRNVIPGEDMTIAVDLAPAEDATIARLSPGYVAVGENSQFTLDLEVSGLPNLIGISFRVHWDDFAALPDSFYIPAALDDQTTLLFGQLDLTNQFMAYTFTRTQGNTTPLVDVNGDGLLGSVVMFSNSFEGPDTATSNISLEITELDFGTSPVIPLGDIATEGSEIFVSSDIARTVHFPDPNLEQAVRVAINKPTGVILETDVNQLQTLSASQAGIANLSGIEALSGLTVLALVDNEITRLEPCTSLTNLTALLLGRNNIRDTWPLNGLQSLQVLELNENQINVPSQISTLTSLQILVLSNNQITDTGWLVNMTDLRVLDLDNNGISDISVMQNLTNLQELELTNNEISDISALFNNSGLGSGDEIFLQGNPLDGAALQIHIPALEARGVSVTF